MTLFLLVFRIFKREAPIDDVLRLKFQILEHDRTIFSSVGQIFLGKC